MPFVIALREHANVDLTCTLLTFLNTLVNSCDALEDRVLVRNELLENGCAAAFPDLRKWAARHDGPDFRAIETQIEVFETERRSDVRDTTRGAVELANAAEVFAFVRAAAAEDGFSAQFLQTLQLMMTVPADREMGYEEQCESAPRTWTRSFNLQSPFTIIHFDLFGLSLFVLFHVSE